MGDHQSNTDGGGDGALDVLVMIAVRVVLMMVMVLMIVMVLMVVLMMTTALVVMSMVVMVLMTAMVLRREDSIALMIDHIWERYWKSQRVMIPARAIVKVQISKCGTTTTFLG